MLEGEQVGDTGILLELRSPFWVLKAAKSVLKTCRVVEEKLTNVFCLLAELSLLLGRLFLNTVTQTRRRAL